MPTVTNRVKDGFEFEGWSFYPDKKDLFKTLSYTVDAGGSMGWKGYDASGNAVNLEYYLDETFHSFYAISRDITVDGITYHLDNDYAATVKAVTGSGKVVIPAEVKDGGDVFTVKTVAPGTSVADTVTALDIPDTITSVGAGVFNKESIKDIYIKTPSFDTAGVFNADATIHCYKGSAEAYKLAGSYDNVDYYGIPVTYHLNGGAFDEKADVQEKAYYRNTFVVPEPAREGYTFTGWFKDEAFTSPAPSTLYYAAMSDSDPESLDYYAKWTEIKNVDASPVDEADNGSYEDNSKSDAEKEAEAEKAKADTEAAAVKEAEAKTGTDNASANATLIKDGVTASSDETTAAGKAKFSFKAVKGKKIKVIVKNADADGVQVQWATSKMFKNPKSMSKILGNRKLYIKGLKKGRTYYVRARAYNIASDGSRVNSKWTKVKKLTIKK